MKEAEKVPELGDVSEATKAFNAFANKCFLLGNAIYKMDKYEKDFEIEKHNILVDIDKLAKEHDAIIAKENKKKAESSKDTTYKVEKKADFPVEAEATV